jgi:hypothetical protein
VLTIFALKSGDPIEKVMEQLVKDRQIRGINNQFGVQAKLEKNLNVASSPRKSMKRSMVSPMRSPLRGGSGIRKQGSAIYKEKPWAKKY